MHKIKYCIEEKGNCFVQSIVPKNIYMTPPPFRFHWNFTPINFFKNIFTFWLAFVIIND
jgi:hypothetical protein